MSDVGGDEKHDGVSFTDNYYGSRDRSVDDNVDKTALKRLLEDLESLSDSDLASSFARSFHRTNAAMAGRFCCRQSKCHGNTPELHISGVGKIALPMAQDAQNQLQKLGHQNAQPKQLAEYNSKQAWQLNASLLAITSSGNPMHIRAHACIFDSAHKLYKWTSHGDMLAQVGMKRSVK